MDYIIMLATINVRAVVDDISCRTIAQTFPSAIGMRVHTQGFVGILYASNRNMKHDLRMGRKHPDFIEDLRFDLKIIEVTHSSEPLAAKTRAASLCIDGENDFEVHRTSFTSPNTVLGCRCLRAFLASCTATDEKRLVLSLLQEEDYWWNRQNNNIKRAIVWRTMNGTNDSAEEPERRILRLKDSTTPTECNLSHSKTINVGL